MRADAAKEKINLSDADVQKLYKQATDDYLTKTKETLSKPAKTEFDTMQKRAGNNEEFLAKLPKSAENIQKMFEGLARKKTAQPQTKANLEAAEQAARDLINRPEFLSSNEIKKALSLSDADARLTSVQGEIAVELGRQALREQYPATKGYEILSEVQLYEDTGFKTKTAWSAANPGKSFAGFEIKNGRVMRKATDIDLLVVRKTSDGKPAEIVQLEQIKSGEQDTGAKAGKQMQKTIQTIREANASGAEVVLEVDGVDITGEVALKTIDKAKQVKRGPKGKAGFDESVGLTASQISKLAREIVK